MLCEHKIILNCFAVCLLKTVACHDATSPDVPLLADFSQPLSHNNSVSTGALLYTVFDSKRLL